MHMDDKNKKELETLIQAVRIYSQYIGMEFGIENAPSRELQIKKKLELSVKRKRANTWEYWKLTPSKRKEKITKKSISGERESYSRQNYIARTLSKG